jgi:hypothetical protein
MWDVGLRFIVRTDLHATKQILMDEEETEQDTYRDNHKNATAQGQGVYGTIGWFWFVVHKTSLQRQRLI